MTTTMTDHLTLCSEELLRELLLAEKKLATLKQLVLLVHPETSHMVVERMNTTIWGLFCREFPDEGEVKRES